MAQHARVRLSSRGRAAFGKTHLEQGIAEPQFWLKGDLAAAPLQDTKRAARRPVFSAMDMPSPVNEGMTACLNRQCSRAHPSVVRRIVNHKGFE